MSEALGGLAVTDIGAGALVTVFVIALLTGRLIPKSTHDREWNDMRDQRNEAVAASTVKDQTIAELSKQNSLLSNGTILATHIAQALHEQQDDALHQHQQDVARNGGT